MTTGEAGEAHFCNLFAQAQGVDPVGYAGTLDAMVAFELPLPWPRGIFEDRRHLPTGVFKAIDWYKHNIPYRLRPLIIAPDADYSVAGMSRVLWLERPSGAHAEYRRHEYLVPTEALGDLVATLIRGRGQAGAFAAFRVPSTTRDMLVCTHGSQDSACGRFGYPLFHDLRRRAQDGRTRVWRVTHFGGHIFAPTLIELPSGRLWAYLEEGRGPALLARSGHPAALRGSYRGWASLEGPFLQAFERELLVREGWTWLERPKAGRVVRQEQATSPTWAEVEMEVHGGAETEVYRGRVVVSHSLGLRPRSDSPERSPYPQYRVTELERVADAAAERVLSAS